MKTNNDVLLSASEVAMLWTTYMGDTMAICGIKYFMVHTHDPKLSSLLEFALGLSQDHVHAISEIFSNEQYPVPLGFTEQDVNLSAPRLYGDKLILAYLENMAKFGMSAYSQSLAFAERLDTITFFSKCLMESKELHNRSKALMQDNGTYIHCPHLPTPTDVEFVNKQSFLGGLFSEKRPLIASEIANLEFNTKRNIVGKAIIMGFSQVAHSEEVRKFFVRGRELAEKHVEVFNRLLSESFMPSHISFDSEVTDSTISPFSDKLMMFHVTGLIATGIGQYGVSMSQSPRKDIGLTYARLMAEIGRYSNDGANIMIDNGWMEKPPHAVDRNELARV